MPSDVTDGSCMFVGKIQLPHNDGSSSPSQVVGLDLVYISVLFMRQHLILEWHNAIGETLIYDEITLLVCSKV